MAITKIHAIRSTIQKSVDYICNPHKTDNRILVDSFCCGIETAGFDFSHDNSFLKDVDNSIPAYHLIQSFAPGEVTFEEAHKIGEELAREILGNSRAYVLATHVDREHVHNHIIFCSADYKTGKRYHDNKKSYRQIRNVSDRLCKEHGLSVIEPGEEKGKKYNEWQADKKNTSYKYILKTDIFECIRYAKDYDDFLRRMLEKGYEIKGAELGEGSAKYISFKPAGYGNFIRGCAKNLGKGHTKEEIIERIGKQIASRQAWKEKQDSLPLYMHGLIDTTKPKIIENEGLKDWADMQNMLIAASAYANTSSLAELNVQVDLIKDRIKQNRSEIVSLDKKCKAISEQIYYLRRYNETLPFQKEYKESKQPDYYLMEHESALITFDGATEYLKRCGINPESISEEDLQQQLDELNEIRKQLNDDSDNLKTKLDELTALQITLKKYIHKEPEKDITEDERSKRKKNGQDL